MTNELNRKWSENGKTVCYQRIGVYKLRIFTLSVKTRFYKYTHLELVDIYISELEIMEYKNVP